MANKGIMNPAILLIGSNYLNHLESGSYTAGLTPMFCGLCFSEGVCSNIKMLGRLNHIKLWSFMTGFSVPLIGTWRSERNYQDLTYRRNYIPSKTERI
jgi:hypothetical protein